MHHDFPTWPAAGINTPQIAIGLAMHSRLRGLAIAGTGLVIDTEPRQRFP
jgi:hypothetical protein